ncbi:MAG: tRNA (adenosine(37)-N6)-threonylcarbamoyltransferase complex ATPase subunit type 1 TsaE [Acidobacteriota bacterium]
MNMVNDKIYITYSEEETFQVGEEIASQWNSPVIVLLQGELGAGKTVLTRGFCSGLGLEDLSLVHSPTFSLVNQYETPSGLLFHIDLYRLDSSKEQYSIGLDEILGDSGFVVIEWPEKLRIPISKFLLIDFKVQDDDSRELSLKSRA